MAYGVLTNTALMAIGLPPAHASALVHTAEIFTTSESAASHIYHRNVDWRMVARLGVTGCIGRHLGCLGSVECRSHRRAPVCLRLFLDNGTLYSLEVDAGRTGPAKTPMGGIFPQRQKNTL
jgi:hypothetical protein